MHNNKSQTTVQISDNHPTNYTICRNCESYLGWTT